MRRVRIRMHVKVCVCSRLDGIARGRHHRRTVAVNCMGGIVGIVQAAGFQIIDGSAEALPLGQFHAWTNASQRLDHRRRAQDTAHNIIDTVVRHEMVRHTGDGHTHGLLDQPRILEAVRIDKRTDQGSLYLRLMCAVTSKRTRGRRGWGVALGGAIMARIGLARPAGGSRSTVGLLHGALLLTRREGLLEFSVDEEVAENSTGTPGHAVGPSLDARRVLLVDEDASTADEMTALPVMRATRDMVQDAGQTGFEENQGICGGRNISRECGLQDGSCTVDHVVVIAICCCECVSD